MCACLCLCVYTVQALHWWFSGTGLSYVTTSAWVLSPFRPFCTATGESYSHTNRWLLFSSSSFSCEQCWLHLVDLDPRGRRCHQHRDASSQSGPGGRFCGASQAWADPRSVTVTGVIVYLVLNHWSRTPHLPLHLFSRAPDVRRRTIFEYHKVDIIKSRICNYTVVEMVPLPSEWPDTHSSFIILVVAVQKMSLHSKQRGSRWPV